MNRLISIRLTIVALIAAGLGAGSEAASDRLGPQRIAQASLGDRHPSFLLSADATVLHGGAPS
ncbi:hypothetical protein ACD578_05285 [Microvirga sp. RSM25]|uniref:hypothetical protein n=1 Tax=Microvirga sp. RSM25 TaxID=3273802 RepID=UPI00385087E2